MVLRITHVMIAVLFVLTTSSSIDNEGVDAVKKNFSEDYNIYALPLPESLTFAGEAVPLSDPEVAERYDREILVNTYWQSNTLLMIKRAAKWLPSMKPIFEEVGVPEDLLYLGLIESGFQNVVSPAGAAGFWQFLEGTAREYDLEVMGEVDERYHVEKSTRAAAEYLKAAHDEFGSWSLAAASYNMGMNGLRRQLDRQKTNNYYDLLLNAETARYVFRIIAVRDILTHPEEFGFHYRPEELYPENQTEPVIVSTDIDDFADWAAERGISYKTLKYYNPWLRDTFLKVKPGESYAIDLPIQGDQALLEE